MGFRPPRKIYNLDFTGTDYEGLTVKMRGFTVGEELELDDLRTQKGGGGERQYYQMLAEILVEWNVDDEYGAPVPTTFDGVCTQDSVMVGAILDSLRKATSGVSDPLPQSSPSGEPSPVVSIPMEPLSPSPESSAVPA
jgi:hypothetical protein